MTGSEKWLPVLDYEGFYEVSNLGRVRSLRRMTATGMRGGQLLNPSVGNHGYLSVFLRREGTGSHRTVHRLVLEAFAGRRPPGQEACHGRGGPHDNSWPENLSWGTHSKNVGHDRLRDGTSNQGEANGSAKLTREDVLAIRTRFAETGVSKGALSREYKVARYTIRSIISGRTWGWLLPDSAKELDGAA